MIIIGLVTASSYGFAQEGDGYKIYYKMTLQKDSNDATKKSEITELLVSDGKSMFRSVIQAERDTNLYHKDLETHPYTVSLTEAEYRILKDYMNNKTHHYETIEPLFGPIYSYTESQDSMAWDLTGDTLTINNLPCQKALLSYGNRVWEAWFCPDVPITDGPYKFCGLPGLIVTVNDTTGSWRFDLMKIEHVPPFQFDLAFLDDAVPLEKEKFFKRKRHYRDNILQINLAAGRLVFPNESAQQAAYKASREQAAMDNNWIELHR